MKGSRRARVGAVIPSQKTAAACGLIYPVLLSGVVAILTVSETGFLRSLGWDPLLHPTLDWPSGLVLGPGGWIMQAGFILTGLLLVGFALGMRRAFETDHLGKTAATLLIVGGAAMLFLASPTDPTLSDAPATLHGQIHDLAFVLLGSALFPAVILLGRVFRDTPHWRSLGVFSWLVAGLALPYFVLKGIAVYPFLAAALVWSELVALRLWQV